MTQTAREIVSKMKAILPPLAEMSLEKRADHMAQVIAFHDLYSQPRQPLGSTDEAFLHMDDNRVALRLGLIAEEFKELLQDGFGIHAKLTYEVPDFVEPATGPFLYDRLEDCFACEQAEDTLHRNGEQVADALGDLIYVIYGMALEMGYDLRDVVAEIHASNLTKLGEDGQPIKREDGKVLKGPNYVPPNIRAVLGFDD